MLVLLAEHHPINPVEHLVFRLLLQLLVLLVVTRGCVWFVRRVLRQTDVTGEILAGIALGPSVLGLLAPGAPQRLFDASTAPVLTGIAQLGVVLLMFHVGMAFEHGATWSKSARAVVAVGAAGILTPFALGYFAAPWFWGQLEGDRPQLLGFRLFFALSLSITALPILGRIYLELGASRTRAANLSISAAAVDDVLGWLLLGVVAAITRASFDLHATALRVAAFFAWLALTLGVVGPMMRRRIAARMDAEGGLSQGLKGWVLAAVFAAALCTSALGVFAIIGAFVLGVALHTDRRFVDAWRARVEPAVNAVMLPVFFAYTGLRTDVGALREGRDWLQLLAVLALAFGGKFGATFIAARTAGEPTRTSLAVGVAMNTRALMELIVINAGRDLGVLPPRLFTILVVMAIVSTYMATPLLDALLRDDPDRERT